MIDLFKISLSQNADKVLNIIYKEYQNRNYNNPFRYKAFFINSIFHNSDEPDLMPSLIELSKHRMIRLFSNNRIMLNDCAISYLEKKQKVTL